LSRYSHTQSATVLRWLLPSSLLAMVPLMLMAGQAPEVVRGLFLLLALVTLAALAVFWTMTVEVTPVHFRFWFGPGLFRKSLPTALIATCEPVDGILAWGIHYAGKRGWLYNVSGRKAVALALHDGRRLMVGTDEPEALCRAVLAAQAAFAAVDATES